MRSYTVTATIPPKKGSDDESRAFRKFAGSQSEAAAVKRDVFEAHKEDGLKRGSIEINEVEIPTNKAGLIPWINENLAD